MGSMIAGTERKIERQAREVVRRKIESGEARRGIWEDHRPFGARGDPRDMDYRDCLFGT